MTRNAIGFKDSCDNCDGLAAAGSGILSRVSDACQITITEFSESYDTQPPMNERYVNYTLSDQERFELQSIIAERAGASDPAQPSAGSEDAPELEIQPRGGMTFDWQEQSLIYQRRLRALMKLVAKEGYAVSSDGRTGTPYALSRFRDAAQASTDEDHPDCSTKREHELYFALMGLAGAVMSRRKEWENWEQGGIKVAPVVRKALRLDGYALSSTER